MPDTIESLQKVQFEVNDVLNSKVSLCWEDITKINVANEWMVNPANKTLLDGEGTDRAIYEASGPGLLDECQKVNGYEISECKVTSGYKLPANYVFYGVGLRGKKENKLKPCYERYLQKIGVYNVKSIAFCCIWTGIPGFDAGKTAEMALNTARRWLKSNHSSVDCVIFLHIWKFRLWNV